MFLRTVLIAKLIWRAIKRIGIKIGASFKQFLVDIKNSFLKMCSNIKKQAIAEWIEYKRQLKEALELKIEKISEKIG